MEKEIIFAKEMATQMVEYIKEKGDDFLDEVDDINEFLEKVFGIFTVLFADIMYPKNELEKLLKTNKEFAMQYKGLKVMFDL